MTDTVSSPHDDSTRDDSLSPDSRSSHSYREDHQAHHLWTNTLDDPYFRMFGKDPAWQWPKTHIDGLKQVMSDVSGLNTLRFARLLHQWSPARQYVKHRKNTMLSRRVTIDLISFIFFWAGIFTALTWLGIWKIFILFWVVPAITFNVLFVRLRWISEHPYDSVHNVSGQSRHVQGNLLERYFIAPLNVNYHIAYHLFPSVPFYNLFAVHQRLLRCPAYRSKASYYRSYLGSRNSVRSEVIKNTFE